MFTENTLKTPLAKKLGLKTNFKIELYNEPQYYFSLFADLYENIEVILSLTKESIDFIHLFCTSLQELQSGEYKNALKRMDYFG